MPICEKCDKEHNGSFGSGRFCSRSCANTRNHTQETKEKIKNSIYKYLLSEQGKEETDTYITAKQLTRLNSKSKENSFKEFIYNAEDRKFLSHPSIDFGERYIITIYGEIISARTKRVMKQAFKKYKDPYIRVVLTDVDGIQHMLTVHRLVAYNFIPNPNNYPIINHKDENPANNNVENLEWCTQQYNSVYNDKHIKTGRKVSETIKRNGGSWNKGLKKDSNGKYIRKKS